MMELELNPDFKEFIALLNERKVKYLIVGGYAVGFHGYPRFTGDIDVWVATSGTNAQQVISALHDFGFRFENLTAEQLENEDLVVQLGYPPNRIDLMTSVTGLTFDECFQKRIEANLDGLLVNFINLEDLKRNKRETGRSRDLGDIENLP